MVRSWALVQGQVLSDGQGLDQVQFLVNDGNALGKCGGGVAKPDLMAVDLDPSRVRPEDAPKDLDQRTFSRAVLAAKGVDLATAEFEINASSRPGRRRIASRFRWP